LAQVFSRENENIGQNICTSMDLRGPIFFEGVIAGTHVNASDTTNFADTILLQVDCSSAPPQGWLTRTQCLRDINGDDKHLNIGDLGSCIEELTGVRDDDGLVLETTKVIQTKSSGAPWKHCRYTLKFEDDNRGLAGKVEFLESSTVVSKQYMRLRRRDRPSINVLRWEGATTEEPGHAAGYTYQSWNLCVLEWNPSPGEVEATLFEVNCLKKIDGSFELGDGIPAFLESWATEFGGASSKTTGTYDQDSGQVVLKGEAPKLWGLETTSWPKKDYTFSMSEDMAEMVGEFSDPSKRKGFARLRAKNHLVANLTKSSDGSTIVCTSLFGDAIAELPRQEETVAEFRARLAASLPHRGLSIDRLKLVLPSGVIVEDSQNDSPMSDLIA